MNLFPRVLAVDGGLNVVHANFSEECFQHGQVQRDIIDDQEVAAFRGFPPIANFPNAY